MHCCLLLRVLTMIFCVNRSFFGPINVSYYPIFAESLTALTHCVLGEHLLRVEDESAAAGTRVLVAGPRALGGNSIE